MAEGHGPDGRFLNGHNSKGGRKPRAAEEDLLARFKAAVTPEDLDEITEVLVTQAKEGNRAAMKLLFNYLFGLPRQAIELEASVQTNVRYESALDRVYRTEVH